MAPTTPVARAAMSAVLFILSFRSVREFAKRRLANVVAPPPKGPVKPSWAHARVEWTDGTIREGWLRAGEGMAFTSRVASEVALRSEEHTSELQSLMRISYAVFCLK